MLSPDRLQRWNCRKSQISVSATHARMMSTESLRIVRAMKGSSRAFGAHAAFNRQTVEASTSCAIVSALTTPSTTKRQPMLSLSRCATMLPTVAGPVLTEIRHRLLLSQQQGTYQRTGSCRPK